MTRFLEHAAAERLPRAPRLQGIGLFRLWQSHHDLVSLPVRAAGAGISAGETAFALLLEDSSMVRDTIPEISLKFPRNAWLRTGCVLAMFVSIALGADRGRGSRALVT